MQRYIRLALAFVGVTTVAVVALAQGASSQSRPVTQQFPPLASYGLRNFVDGIDYPDWFGSPAISATDRSFLVSEFNLLQWYIFQDRLQSQIDPHIQTPDGRTIQLQPLLDGLEAVAGTITPEASQVANGTQKRPIRPRDRKLDTPAAAEDRNASIAVINDELRWFRQTKYKIPPTIASAPVASLPAPATRQGYDLTTQEGYDKALSAARKASSACVDRALACAKPCSNAGSTQKIGACLDACDDCKQEQAAFEKLLDMPRPLK